MDTKWRRWKIAFSFLAFFLGVSMILSSVLGVLGLRSGAGSFKELFQYLTNKDYQETREFRSSIGESLEMFLTLGAGGDLDWYDDEEERREYYQRDKNLLYVVSYDGQVKETNADDLKLTPPSANAQEGKLPDGYNFLLYFDGKSTEIIKDGKKIDVYGDGYYREASDQWYVPGYGNFTVDEETAKVTVLMAAAKTPKLFLHGAYSEKQQTCWHNNLYWIQDEMERVRKAVLACAVTLLLGAALLAASFTAPLRSGRKEAVRKIAGFTGKIWFEVKALLVLLAALGIFSGFGYESFDLGTTFLAEVYESRIEDIGMVYTGELTSILFQDIFGHPLMILLTVWLVYFGIHDLKFNPKPWRQSLYRRLCKSFRAAELRRPFQNRLARRELLLALAAGITGVTVGVLYVIYAFNSYSGVLVSAVFIILLLGGLAAGVLYHLKCGKELAGDMGALIDQIAAIRAGDLKEPLILPADADLRQAADDLNQIQEGMNEALEERTKSERMKVELITNVSHDIKTPLTSIISYAEILKGEENLPEDIKDYIQILDSKAQRLKTMVQDVFEVSKAAAGQLPIRLEILDFGKLLRQTLADMAEAVERSSVSVRTEIPEELILIRADGQRLYRVFQNLLQNALAYSLDGSRVFVTLKSDGTIASASVKNTSKIEIQGDLDYTERFVRGDESRTDGGSGLGLSIASSFTEACGGSFRIETIADLFVATVEFQRVEEVI